MRSKREPVANGEPPRDPFEGDPDAPPALGDDDATGTRTGASSDTAAVLLPWAACVTPVSVEWITSAPPRRTWLLRDARRPQADGVLPLGKVAAFVAEGGVGKTMALAQLACAVASGEKWLGTLSVPAPGRVLLVLGEEDAEEARRRIYNAARTIRAKADAIAANVVTLPLAGLPCAMIEMVERSLVDAPFLHWLREYIAAHGPWALIIADPLARFAGPAAETDNAAATRFVQALESIASSTGATVLASHHTNKPSRGDGAIVDTSSSRGSTALTDGVRFVATMGASRLKTGDPEVQERLGEIVTLSFTKSNYSRKADPILLRRDLDNGGALVLLDETDRDMVAAERAPKDPHAAKTKQRETDREERERKNAEARAARATDREAETRCRNTDDDATARALVAAAPGASVRVLVAQLKAARACGTDRALAAIHRVRGVS